MTTLPPVGPQTSGPQGHTQRVPGRLLHQVSKAAFWNTLMLPLIATAALLLSVVIRRRFGLLSGVYDVTLGLTTTLLRYSSAGIPRSLSKFLPEVGALSGLAGLRSFLGQVVFVRLVLLACVLLPVNVFADQIASALDLGPSGARYIVLASGLALARAVLDLSVTTLNTFFAQFWSNLFALAKAMVDLLLVGLVVLLGYGIAGVLGGLMASASLVALLSSGYVAFNLERLSRPDVALAEPAGRGIGREDAGWLGGEGKRFLRFSSFVYLLRLMGFFTRMGFVAPGLALVNGVGDAAVFGTAFSLSFMTMNLVIAGFRGLYQPLFARLRLRDDAEQLRRAFAVLSKGQVITLLPAGMGLFVMSGDYIPLLFGAEFVPSIPIARVLITSIFLSTTLNLCRIILTVDEQYRSVLWVRLIAVVMAPAFLVTAATKGLTVAALVFGGTQLAAAGLSYAMCHRRYGLRFPWAFAGRVSLVSLAMAVTIGGARLMITPTWLSAVALTVLGAVLFGFGLRLARVVGRDEVDLLRRSHLPGRDFIVAWLAPAHAARTAAGP